MRIASGDPFALYCSVYLDGQQLRYGIEADEDEGWVRCAITGPDGRLAHIAAGEEERTEVVRGEVRIVFDPPEWRAVVEAAQALAKVAPDVELYARLKGRQR